MKLLAASLAASSVTAVYNIRQDAFSDASVEVQWDSSDTSVEYYEVSITAKGEPDAVIETIQTSDKFAEFSSLAGGQLYDVDITPYVNGTASNGNRFQARTNGLGIGFHNVWGYVDENAEARGGADGYILWPVSTEPTCGEAFSFALPCPDIDWYDFGAGSGVTKEKVDNSTMRVHVSHKAASSHNFLNFVAMGKCDFNDYNLEDYVLETFVGYQAASGPAQVISSGNWTAGAGETVKQYRIPIPEEFREDCAPQFTIQVDCPEDSVMFKADQSWSAKFNEEGNGFNADDGVWYFSGVPENDWISELGFTFGHTDACDGANVSATLTYNIRV